MKAYNKRMGGVDLADMLIALFQISVKTKRWYIRVFWHLLDIAEVNGWILYKRHRMQQSIPQKDKKKLLNVSCELTGSLRKANNTVASSWRGRLTKRKSYVAKKGEKKQLSPFPVLMYVTTK